MQKGNEININISESETKTVKMPYIGRFKDTWSSYIIIGLFGAVYLIMLLRKYYKAILEFFGISI